MHAILHISDLHRSSLEPVTNDTLVASLLADRDRFVLETPAIPAPDSIIVSGDIIQGALLGATDWKTDIASQYDVAYEFLAELSERIVEGDRTRVVLLPGNHDVCWNTAREAMSPVGRNDEPKGVHHLFTPTSKYRWSWQDRSTFKIDNSDTYRRRLDAYWTFAERFYNGTRLAYPLVRDAGFNLFELDGGKIVVAAFDSVHGNDCFCFQGAIDDGAVSRCGLAIRDSGKPYLLRLATWHHSIQGPPQGTDYMDAQTVHEMIGNGFRLGLHGHQHLASAGAHYIHLPEQQQMAVVSAGSLCAGSGELPRGVDRQYGVIVVDDSYLGARVHVREMRSGYQFGRCTRGPFTASGSINLEWERPADPAGRSVDPVAKHEREVQLRAEAALQSGDPATAERELSSIATPLGSYGRLLLVEAAHALRNWSRVTTLLAEPGTADELVLLVHALLEQNEMAKAATALAHHAARLGLAPHIHRELAAKIELRSVVGRRAT